MSELEALAVQGDPEGLFQLGLERARSGYIDDAAQLWEEAANRDHKEAKLLLAKIHTYTTSWPQANPDTAVRLLNELIAESNDSDPAKLRAKTDLGFLYCSVNKIKWNPDKGWKLLNEVMQSAGIENFPFVIIAEFADIYFRGIPSGGGKENPSVDDLIMAAKYFSLAIDLAKADGGRDIAALSHLWRESVEICVKRLIGKPSVEASRNTFAFAPEKTAEQILDEMIEEHGLDNIDDMIEQTWEKEQEVQEQIIDELKRHRLDNIADRIEQEWGEERGFRKYNIKHSQYAEREKQEKTSTDKTIKIIKQIKRNIKKIQKDIDNLKKDYHSVQSDIEKNYRDYVTKLAQAKADKDKKFAQEELGKEKDRIQTQEKNYNSALIELKKIGISVPEWIREKYWKKAESPYTPKKPELKELKERARQINDSSVSGFITRVFKSSMSEMVKALFDDIESARAYINQGLIKCVALQKKAGTEANNKIMEADEELKRIMERIKEDLQIINTDTDNVPGEQIVSADDALQQKISEARKKYLDQKKNNEQQYNFKTASLNSELENIINKSEIIDFDNELILLRSKLAANDEGWEGYTPSASYPSEIMIGTIEVPFEIPKPWSDKLIAKMPVSYWNGRSIKIPMSLYLGEPLNMQIDYDISQKKTVMEGIQSFILKLIKFMPANSFSLTYIDPNDRGTNLGLLQKLTAITASDICKKIYASKEDIARRLKELETFVDQTSIQLAGIDNIYKYNESHDPKITYQFVVINDYPDNLEGHALESLKILRNNAYKCGISFICTSSKPQNENSSADIVVQVRKDGAEVPIGGQGYNFAFGSVIPACKKFIEAVEDFFYKKEQERIKEQKRIEEEERIMNDNKFSKFIDLILAEKPKESEIKIPFAIDSSGHLVSMELGSARAVHALLSGRSGSGKSKTLHMIISSIIMKYHPDDVELWLVDYKLNEFAKYLEPVPPHVKLLGLEKGIEFTFSLLDKIYGEMEQRQQALKDHRVEKITEYNKIPGVNRMPRILFIVDEFHQLTQAIQGTEYVMKLENILAEGRSYGIHCIFSDQAISDGLRGLTEKGRKQISVRLAMENEISEVKETLALDYSFYNDALNDKIKKMGTGDIVFKRFSDDGEIVLDKYKTILIEKEEVYAVVNRAKECLDDNHSKKDLLIIDGQKLVKYDEAVIDSFEKEKQIDVVKTIPLYIGAPANLDPCFSFSLHKQIGSNVMLIGKNDELRASVIIHAILSFKRQQNTSVIIFAHPSDEIYRHYEKHISKLLDNGSDDCLITNLSSICNKVDDLSKLISTDNQQRFLICWLGLDELAEEFSGKPEKPKLSNVVSASTQEEKSALDSLTEEMDDLLNSFGDNENRMPPVSPPDSNLSSPEYDARDDINQLFAKGSRFNLYSLVTFSSISMIRRLRFINLENFEHKIALDMTRDESTTFLGRGTHASGLDNLSAIYDDGSGTIRKFRPYAYKFNGEQNQ